MDNHLAELTHLSLESESCAVSSSRYTTTSASTVAGPGALAGKAILALGKAVLRGVEAIIIRQRLSAIITKLPQFNAATATLNIHGMYDDLLELSRPDFYTPTIRYQALQLLFRQIARDDTEHLVFALSNWASVEVRLFLVHIMHVVPWLWTHVDISPFDEELMHTYRQSRPVWSTHSALPFVQFLTRLAKTNHMLCQEVLDAGFLDMLVSLYADDFRDAYTIFSGQETVLLSSCNAALAFLSTHLIGSRYVQLHPVYVLWPQDPDLAFPHLPNQRLNAWRKLGPEYVVRRIRRIGTGFAKWGPTSDYIFDASVDILEFSGCTDLEPQISALAIERFCGLNHLALPCRAAIEYMRHGEYADFVAMITRILQSVAAVDLSVWCERSYRSMTQSFLHFLLTTATHDDIFRRAMLDAGVVKLSQDTHEGCADSGIAHSTSL